MCGWCRFVFPVLVGVLLPGPASAGSDPVPRYTPPRTLELTAPASVRAAPQGETLDQVAPGTLITSDRRRAEWVQITGHFPDGTWQEPKESRWVPAEAVDPIRSPQPKQALTQPIEAATFQLERDVAVREQPGGPVQVEWPQGRRFTARKRRGDWLRVAGYFPQDEWVEARRSLWLSREAVADISPPDTIPRPAGAERKVVVDKSDFRLEVRQSAGPKREILYQTEVGLGMDDCLPEAHGGECYYTRPGRYEVRWKVHKPDGIDWCIPDHMADEPEYARDLARGKRCFKGVLGKFAVNIGRSYAIHGTQDLDTLGKKASHGCIRVHPDAARRIWRYLEEGDPVVIRP